MLASLGLLVITCVLLDGVSGEMCGGFVRRSPVTTFIAR